MATNHGYIAKNKLLLIALFIVLVALVGLFIKTHQKSKNLINNGISVQGATSKPTPHQGPSVAPVPNQSGGAVDNSGQLTGSLPPASQWITSNSGAITLQRPTSNAKLNSGANLTGIAKYDLVQFILKDDSIGQIAQGSLKVVNGRFSGTLDFTAHSSTGKLEVYYPNPNTGAQVDTIIINVNFNVQ